MTIVNKDNNKISINAGEGKTITIPDMHNVVQADYTGVFIFSGVIFIFLMSIIILGYYFSEKFYRLKEKEANKKLNGPEPYFVELSNKIDSILKLYAD